MNLKKIGVVGAGMMGAEIALCFAKEGYEVIISDTKLEYANKGKARLSDILDKNIKKGKFEASQKETVLDRLIPTENLEDMSDCDFIVEAVLENVEIKQDVYKRLDAICKENCIIASNTSSISVTKLSSVISPERASKFIGTHFNSPASIMKLVEVIPGYLTDRSTTTFTIDLLREIKKEPVEVKDVTGFALNRLFHVFTAEACRLLDEGVATAEDIDKICVYGLGHPVGIFKLLDNLGNDLNISVDKILFDAYGERFRPSLAMQRLVDAGKFGRKTGEGFYKYDK